MHEEIPPQVEQVPLGSKVHQVPIVEGGNDVLVAPPELSNSDIKEALLALARVLTTQANFSKVPRVNVVPSTMTSRLRDFVRMNPPIFLGSKVGYDPQEFLDRVYMVLSVLWGLHLVRRWSWLRTN